MITFGYGSGGTWASDTLQLRALQEQCVNLEVMEIFITDWPD